jgi:hypothetical protein
MVKLTPMQEARDSNTPEVRLLALATGENAGLRRTAQWHPRLGKTFRDLLLMAEKRPEGLSPDDLDWLSRQGPFGVQVAAAHAQTPDEALKRLVMAGHARAVLGKKTGRDDQWLLALARQDSALMAYLSREYSVECPATGLCPSPQREQQQRRTFRAPLSLSRRGGGPHRHPAREAAKPPRSSHLHRGRRRPAQDKLCSATPRRPPPAAAGAHPGRA